MTTTAQKIQKYKIQVDYSGQGHCWETPLYIPSAVVEEIEGSIEDNVTECRCSNGHYYRWTSPV